MSGRDSLGDRMKKNYEDRTRASLPRRTNTIIRVDGRAFHSLTRNCVKPFDRDLAHAMDRVALQLCRGIAGAKMAFVQSDEVSVWVTDYDSLMTEAWFDGNVQKICSISAALATQAFNAEPFGRFAQGIFDARCFSIPEVEEVANYFIWRQQDAMRNSVQMAARAAFSHKECEEKSVGVLREMLLHCGIDWEDYPVGFRRGRTVVRVKNIGPVSYLKNGLAIVVDDVERFEWKVDSETPVFSEDRRYILARVPQEESDEATR